MNLINELGVDTSHVWTWFLLSIRMLGMLISMPGIGTAQVPGTFRNILAIILAATMTIAGAKAEPPAHMLDGGIMIASELLLGYLFGAIPAFIIGGLAVAGQVTTGAMGLGQANMIDPSLGGSVAVLARVESLVATTIFLLIDGHHVLIRAASGLAGDIGIGMFRPDMSTAMIMVERFRGTFELAVIVSAPILVTLLVTQFVLGLITKFVPQVNIFIISLPLTILIGFFIFGATLPELSGLVIKEIGIMGEVINQLITL